MTASGLHWPGTLIQVFWLHIPLTCLCTTFFFSSVTQSRPTLCNPIDCSTPDFLSIINSWSLLKFMSIELVMSSKPLILCHPLLLLPSIFLSIRVFLTESVLHIRWPKYWSFSISPSNKYSWLISFRIDWFDLLAVKGFSRVFSRTTIQKHQFFDAQPSLWSSSYIYTQLLETL